MILVDAVNLISVKVTPTKRKAMFKKVNESFSKDDNVGACASVKRLTLTPHREPSSAPS